MIRRISIYQLKIDRVLFYEKQLFYIRIRNITMQSMLYDLLTTKPFDNTYLDPISTYKTSKILYALIHTSYRQSLIA